MDKVFQSLYTSKDQLIKTIQTSIGFNSVKADPLPGAPFGSETRAALDHALTEAEKMGFKVKNLDGYCGYAEYGDGEEYIAVLGHLDIVPFGNGWDSPPLEARIVDNCIVGRGSIDDKGPIFVGLYAMKAIKDAGVPLNHRIRIIFGCDEETGMTDMVHYLKHEPGPCYGITPDCDFPVVYGEKGHLSVYVSDTISEQPNTNVVVNISGGDTMNIVPDRAEAVIRVADVNTFIDLAKKYSLRTNCNLTVQNNGSDVTIKVKGQAAHAMNPQLGDNAVSHIFAIIAEANLMGSLAEFTNKIHRLIGREINGQSLGIYCFDEDSGKITLNLSRIRYNNGKAEIGCDLRIPVTLNPENTAAKLREVFSSEGLTVNIPKVTQPLYYPRDSYLVTTLNDIFCKHFGKQFKPMTTGGGTYAKKLPNTVAYGIKLPGGRSGGEHQVNEKLDIDEMMIAAKIVAEAMIRLATK